MKTSICVHCLEPIYYGIPKNFDPTYKYYEKDYTPPILWFHEGTHIATCARTGAEPINGFAFTL